MRVSSFRRRIAAACSSPSTALGIAAARSAYRVTTVTVDASGQASDYDTFASGWLRDGDEVWGRPVDLLELQDGSLLLSDDLAGVIYRISYDGAQSASAGQ